MRRRRGTRAAVAGAAAVLVALAPAACDSGAAFIARETDSLEVGQAEAPAAELAAGVDFGDAAKDVGFRRHGASGEEAAPGIPGGGAVLSPEAPAMLIRTGNALVEVDTLPPAIAQVEARAAAVGGYVAGTGVQSGAERRRRARLELKLPADRWEDAVGRLPAVGRIIELHVDAQDVGEEYVDLEARLESARRFEQRMVELLGRRTGSLEDVLAVERELARVREQIERVEGRLRHLRSRVAWSTLTITLQEPAPLVGAYPGESVIGQAFRQAWQNFVVFAATLIAALGFIVPVLALAAPPAFIAYRKRRGRRS